MTQKKVFIFLGIAILVAAGISYFRNEQQDTENSMEKEPMAEATPSVAPQASQPFRNREAASPIQARTATPQESAGTETTFVEMRKMFADSNFLKQPSGEVIAKFKSMGFQFAEKKSSNPHTGSRQVLDLETPHKGFTRLQIQYASDASREILEGIRFTVSSHHFESFVNDIVANASSLKPIQQSDAGAVYETSDGYRLWFKVYDEKNPPPQGENSNVMTGGFEPRLN
jgi:hypothetical protein